MVQILKVFKRVMTRLLKRSGLIRDKVDDVPSSFLVAVARLKQTNREEYEELLKQTVNDDDRDDADASVSDLIEYVGKVQQEGRNRNKIKRKSRRAKKSKAKRTVAH